MAVHERMDRALGAFEEFLHHDACARSAERILLHASGNRAVGFCKIGGNDHPLAKRQSIGLHDQRILRMTAKFPRRRGLGELPVCGSGDSMALHEILRERLR